MGEETYAERFVARLVAEKLESPLYFAYYRFMDLMNGARAVSIEDMVNGLIYHDILERSKNAQRKN